MCVCMLTIEIRIPAEVHVNEVLARPRQHRANNSFRDLKQKCHIITHHVSGP